MVANSGKQQQIATEKIIINDKWQPTVADNNKLRLDKITINNGWWPTVADSDNYDRLDCHFRTAWTMPNRLNSNSQA